jgi:hypothetical protein
MVDCALWGVTDAAREVLWMEGGFCSYSPTPKHVLLTYMVMRWEVGLVPL